MGIVIIDGREIEISDQERLNAIQAAARAGVEIPR
jgi:NADH dehydrogenase/NADH:ubiquinone oxidoreductase subunit G